MAWAGTDSKEFDWRVCLFLPGSLGKGLVGGHETDCFGLAAQRQVHRVGEVHPCLVAVERTKHSVEFQRFEVG